MANEHIISFAEWSSIKCLLYTANEQYRSKIFNEIIIMLIINGLYLAEGRICTAFGEATDADSDDINSAGAMDSPEMTVSFI